jgi:hypothetical protein
MVPYFDAISQHSPGGMKKTTKYGQDSRSTEEDSNPRPLNYEAGVLYTRLRRGIQNLQPFTRPTLKAIMTGYIMRMTAS